jgi:hypothetical protein
MTLGIMYADIIKPNPTQVKYCSGNMPNETRKKIVNPTPIRSIPVFEHKGQPTIIITKF